MAEDRTGHAEPAQGRTQARNARVAAVLHATAVRARTEASALPEAQARPTRYAVCLLPEEDVNYPSFVIMVKYRGRGLWGVFHRSRGLSVDGEWDGESIPSNRVDEWLARHRFDLETALERAKAAAPLITVNGHTVSDALRDAQEG